MDNRFAERIRLTVEKLLAIGFAPFKETGVVNQAIFDDFGIASPQFPVGEAVEHERVDQHEAGLVETADQILAHRAVDRRLAADAAVYLGKQAGRNLHEVAAALDYGCGKSGEITDHAAAQRDQRIRSLGAFREQPVGHSFQLAPALAGFACRQAFDDKVDRASGKGVLQSRQQMRSDMVIGQHEKPLVGRKSL